jgi:DNA-binding transcriptional LysR family regulator
VGGFVARLGEDLTLGQLRTFICVALSGSFVRAADTLGISQPAVSEQITALEERLGYALFRRRRGTTPVLTADGTEALRKAHEIIEAADGLVKDTPGLARKTVTLSVAIGPLLCEAYLKPLLPRIYREHPQILIDTWPLVPFSEIGKALNRGRLDLAVYTVAPHAGGWTDDLNCICDVPTVLIAPPGTRRELASGRTSLADYQFLIPGARDQVEPWAFTIFAELGIRPRLEPAFFQLADVIEQLVIDGQGIGVRMYESVKDSIREGKVELLDYRLPRMRRIIGRSPHAPPEARILEAYLREALLREREEPACTRETGRLEAVPSSREGTVAPPPQNRTLAPM